MRLPILRFRRKYGQKTGRRRRKGWTNLVRGESGDRHAPHLKPELSMHMTFATFVMVLTSLCSQDQFILSNYVLCNRYIIKIKATSNSNRFI